MLNVTAYQHLCKRKSETIFSHLSS